MKPLIGSEIDPPLKPVLVTDDVGLQELNQFLANAEPIFGLDVETNVTRSYPTRRTRTIQIGNRSVQYVIDLLAYAMKKLECSAEGLLVGGLGHYNYHAVFQQVVDVIKPFCENPKITKLGHNIEFEYHMLKWCFGIRTQGMYCSLLAEKILYCGEEEFDKKGFWALDDLIGRYFGLSIDKELQKSFDLVTPLTSAQVDYAAIDVRVMPALRDKQMKRINAEGLLKTLEVENNCIGAFGDMHLNGMLLDAKQWTEYSLGIEKQKVEVIAKLDEIFIPVVGVKQELDKSHVDALEQAWRDCPDNRKQLKEEWLNSPNKTEDEKKARKLKRQAYSDAVNDLKVELARRRQAWVVADREYRAYVKESCKYDGRAAINYSANNQLRDALLKMGFKEKQLPNTEDRTLQRLMGHPAIDNIRTLRGLEKKLTTYGMKTLKAIDPDTGRIHSNILQIGAATGRPSSREPNILNFPRVKEMRKCFIAPPGRKIVRNDCTGQELRLMCELAGETKWIEAFKQNWDVHSMCAEDADVERWKSETSEGCVYESSKLKCKCPGHLRNREEAKSNNFLMAYGGGEYKLADELNNNMNTTKYTAEYCRNIIQRHKANYPTLWSFLERSGLEAKTHMEARTPIGRRRKFKRPTWEEAIEFATKRLKKKGIEREANQRDISSAYAAMFGAIEREGRNLKIQGAGADLMKIAMGSGYDKNNEPFMWHRLEPEFGAKLLNFCYDEFVVEAREDNAQEVSDFLASCITRAGSEFLSVVPITSESAIADHWSK